MVKFFALLFLLTGLSNFTLSVSYGNLEYCEGTSWVKFQNSCYLFVERSRLRVSFYDAEDYCRSRGAHLVSIHSREENDFVLHAMKEGRFGGRLWIGLDTFAGEDRPRWSDSSEVDFQKRLRKEYYADEKCFIMFSSRGGWRPEHCALHYAPICKRPDDVTPKPIPPPTQIPPVEGNCPQGWMQFGPKCYKYFGAEDTLRYREARNACRILGEEYDLVSIHSEEEQAFLTQHLYDLGTTAWIGMRQVTSDEIGHDLVFGWTDNSRTLFTRWAKGHPPPGTWKYCARLDYDGINKGEWIADYCDVDRKGYICQRPSDPELPAPRPETSKCDDGSTGYRRSCYWYVSQPDTWDGAEAACRKRKGHLVSVTDGFEHAFLYNFLDRESRSIWTGLKNVQGSRLLRWSDGQPLYFSNWAARQPDLEEGANRCISMDASDGLQWGTSACGSRLPFVCETSHEVAPDVPEVLGACPSDGASWIDVGDEFCYQAAASHALSWDAAARYCAARGMQMLKVNSDHQTKTLLAYFRNETRSIHLALIRSSDKSSFVWADGSGLTYTNWADREPSSWSSGKDCAAFSQRDGKWSPAGCNEWGVTLCRVEKRES